MSVIQAAGAGETSFGFYSHTIDQSLRFQENDAPHLDRTFSYGGNAKTWTWSCWVKMAGPDAQKMIFSGGSSTSDLMYIQLRGDSQSNRLDITWRQGSASTTYGMSTTREFRDPTAWMHIVWAVDTTQGTASNRIRLYINGTEETSFSNDNRSNVSQSSDLAINGAHGHSIGTYVLSPSAYFDGYMAEIHFVDGTQLTPASFGETKAGIWIPKKYTGSHGTTGFYLPFDDSSAIGDDESANTNDWTPSGLAATDVVLDSPTNNFGVLNELTPSHSTLSEASLRVASLGAATRGNFAVSSGKWYFEIFQDDSGTFNYFMGVIENDPAATAYYVGMGQGNGGNSPNIFNVLTNTNGTVTQPTGSRVSQVVIGIALDMDGGNVYFYYNGSLNGKVESITTSEFTEMVSYMSPYTGTIGYQPAAINYGQDSSFAGNKTAGGNTDENGNGDFFHSVPSGYLAMCTASLPDPGVDPAQGKEPADNFDTQLWTGTGSGQTFSNFTFQPDWLWFKNRNGGSDHAIFDSVRGVNAGLTSNSTGQENTAASGSQDLVSFDSDGFTTGTPSQYGSLGSNTLTIATWAWKGGGSAVSNSAGDIASSVSANTEAGFSIVSYTGNGNNGDPTVGHGLLQTPEFVILRNRDDTASWFVSHKDLTSNYYIYLQSTSGQLNGASSSGGYITNNHTSSAITLSSGSSTTNNVNANTKKFIAYCFHNVDGYSKIGKYIGNGSSNGPFVPTGFRPSFLLIKRSDSTGSWYIMDNKRNTFNVVNNHLYPNLASAESASSHDTDFLSNGFKTRGSAADLNASGGTYVYLAIAEQPAKYSNAR